MSIRHTFRVEIREVKQNGRQITADVVRNDGLVVRSGMWPDYAEADCALLNEYCARGWSAEKYHAERATRMARLRGNVAETRRSGLCECGTGKGAVFGIRDGFAAYHVARYFTGCIDAPEELPRGSTREYGDFYSPSICFRD